MGRSSESSRKETSRRQVNVSLPKKATRSGSMSCSVSLQSTCRADPTGPCTQRRARARAPHSSPPPPRRPTATRPLSAASSPVASPGGPRRRRESARDGTPCWRSTGDTPSPRRRRRRSPRRRQRPRREARCRSGTLGARGCDVVTRLRAPSRRLREGEACRNVGRRGGLRSLRGAGGCGSYRCRWRRCCGSADRDARSLWMRRCRNSTLRGRRRSHLVPFEDIVGE